MSESAADRLLARKTATRPMPTIIVPAEGQPALAVGRKPAAKRKGQIHSPVSNRTIELVDLLVQHFRKTHGRGWRINDTVERAIELLAEQEGLIARKL